MLGISSFISKILTSKHWHMPKADTATFEPLHVTSLQGSKRKYNNIYKLIKLIKYYLNTVFAFEIRGLLPCVVVVVSSAVVATVGPWLI